MVARIKIIYKKNYGTVPSQVLEMIHDGFYYDHNFYNSFRTLKRPKMQ